MGALRTGLLSSIDSVDVKSSDCFYLTPSLLTVKDCFSKISETTDSSDNNSCGPKPFTMMMLSGTAAVAVRLGRNSSCASSSPSSSLRRRVALRRLLSSPPTGGKTPPQPTTTKPPLSGPAAAKSRAGTGKVGTGEALEATTTFIKDRGPVSWPSLFLVGVAAASIVAYYNIERERRLESAMGRVVSSESDGWTPNPDVMAPRKFKLTPWGWFPEDDGFGPCKQMNGGGSVVGSVGIYLLWWTVDIYIFCPSSASTLGHGITP